MMKDDWESRTPFQKFGIVASLILMAVIIYWLIVGDINGFNTTYLR